MTGRTAIYLISPFLAGLFAYALFTDPAKAPAQALPDGFTEARVTDVPLPTALDFTPDGRMLVTSKPGKLYLHKDGQTRQVLNLDRDTCDNSERGLLGVAVDPRFKAPGHKFVYLYYTFNKYGKCLARQPESDRNPVNRVSRFAVRSDGTVARGTERVLLNNIMSPKGNHNGGDLHFGKDGNLYVSVGDGGCDYAEPTRCQYENDASRDKNILNGKILRIKPDGSIPADNPFVGAGSRRCNLQGKTERGKNCQETYLKGFRNPFRFAVDPDAEGTLLRINDVGGNSWEEIDEAKVGTGDDGNDYGWNICEGNHDNPDRSGSVNCDGDTYTGPIHEYNHDSTGCGSITGGAFVPDGFWPTQYDDVYLFGDYVCGRIFSLEPAGDHGRKRTVFADGMGQGSATAMAFGPLAKSNIALYYASFENGGVIRRIAYRTPTAQVAMAKDGHGNPQPNYGDADATQSGLQMNFDASGSTDPDDEPLTYLWDFGDGTLPETTSAPTNSHTYAERGKYTVRLRVENPQSGAADTATIDVFPGDTPPEPTIVSPDDESTFTVARGESDRNVTARGSASDPDGDAVQSLKWQVLRYHNGSHAHPWASGTGQSVSFSGAPPEDLDSTDPNGNYLGVRLTVTDALGLSKTTSIELRPKTVDLTFRTQPSGLRVKVNGRPFVAPHTLVSWVGYDLNLSAPRQRDAEGRQWGFESWSDGRAGTHTIDSPEDPKTYTATFRRIRN